MLLASEKAAQGRQNLLGRLIIRLRIVIKTRLAMDWRPPGRPARWGHRVT